MEQTQDILDPKANAELEDYYQQEEADLELNLEENQRKIIWQAKDFSIREFLSMKADKELVLQPDYQRNFVASPQIASKLVESILLDV